MDKQLQQRILGAAVIVALVVVFVPELVRSPEPVVTPGELPPEPDLAVSGADTGGLTPPAGDLDGAPRQAVSDTLQEPVAPAVKDSAEAESELALAQPPEQGQLPAEPPPPAPAEPLPVEPPPPAEAPPPEPQPIVEQPRRSEPPPRQTEPPRRSEPPPEPASRTADPEPRDTPPEQVALPALQLIGRPMAQYEAESRPRWMVQAGSFRQRDNADRLREQLRAQRFPAGLYTTTVEGRTLYRVRVGPHSSRAESERTRDRLRQLGFKGDIVPVYN